MNISYFTYDLARTSAPGNFTRMDLRALVSKWAAMQKKKLVSVDHGEDKLFLLPEAAGVYLLVQTRDEELARVLSRSNKQAKDVRSALATGDSLGFASYLYVADHWLALGCRVLSPRARACEHFLNTMLRAVGLPLLLRMTAVQTNLTTKDARQLSFVSSVRVAVTDTSKLTQDIVAALGLANSKYSAGEIEIKFKPKNPGSNAPLLKSLLSNVPNADIARLQIRAKTALQDQLADYFVVGSGNVRDNIDDDPATVSQHVRSAAASNVALQMELQEHTTNVDAEKNLPGLLDDLLNRAASVHLSNSLVPVDGVEVVP
jgi:hypothetical protein